MARPLKTGLSYFPHDVDAFNDEKIEAMRILHGNDGYTFFFMLCERIYRSDNAELDVSTVETTRILSGKLAVTEEKYKAMLTTALSQQLFDPERYNKDRVLTSKGIKARAEIIFRKREFDRKSYLENVSTVETTTETPTETHQRKPTTETRSKVNRNKTKQDDIPRQCFGEFNNVFLSEDERGKLVERFGEQGTKDWVEELSSGKQSKGYKYKSDYAAILSWDRLHKSRGNGGSPNHIARPEVFQMPVMEIK